MHGVLKTKGAKLLRCSNCWAVADTCDCSAPRVSALQLATAAIAANPEKSSRAIGEKIGVSPQTIQRVRKRAGYNKMQPRPLIDQLDKTNPDAPFLAYVVRASDSWQLAQQAATMIPGIIEKTKPCPEDWATMIELTRKAADEWTRLALKVEAMIAPATRRRKRILATPEIGGKGS